MGDFYWWEGSRRGGRSRGRRPWRQHFVRANGGDSHEGVSLQPLEPCAKVVQSGRLDRVSGGPAPHPVEPDVTPDCPAAGPARRDGRHNFLLNSINFIFVIKMTCTI